MSFEQDPSEQANISGADLAVLVDDLRAARLQRDRLLAALKWVVHLSDRKHDAWDAAHAIIDEVEGT